MKVKAFAVLWSFRILRAVIRSANNPEEFYKALGNTGISVERNLPSRKRKTMEELWCLRKLFDVKITNQLITWPVSIWKQETPDFIIQEGENHNYGLEITQAIANKDAREVTLAHNAEVTAYLIGSFGGNKVKSNLDTATEICVNIQNAITKKSTKQYATKITDLLIYIRGNNVIWLDGNSADEEGRRYQEIIGSIFYRDTDMFRNVILYWDSGRTYYLRKNDDSYLTK